MPTATSAPYRRVFSPPAGGAELNATRDIFLQTPEGGLSESEPARSRVQLTHESHTHTHQCRGTSETAHQLRRERRVMV